MMSMNKKIILLICLLIATTQLYAQTPASPSNWMYPDGNLSATKYNKFRSERFQIVDSFKIKWTSNEIRGDVQPLIGNIVHNQPIILNSSEFRYSPNEISAIIGDTLVILDGSGKTITHFCIRNNDSTGNEIIGISALLDTSSSLMSPEYTGRTLIMGFESIEAEREDSLAVTFLGGWNHNTDSFLFVRRIALNLQYDPVKFKDYLPNYSASIKPLYARKRYLDDWDVSNDSSGFMVYATVNMSQPKIADRGMYDTPLERQYFRGLTAFNLHHSTITFPMPDIGDMWEYRIHFGPQVSFVQPSISPLSTWDTTNHILLPCKASPVRYNDYVLNSQVWTTTAPNLSYIFDFRLDKDGILSEGYLFYEFYDEEIGRNPRIRSYFVELQDAGNEDVYWEDRYILTTTEYNGTGEPISAGRSGLFLFDFWGTPLYDFYATDDEQEMLPFFGGINHYWSIANGNVDGWSGNQWQPYYPNNPGKEIIATQSTRDFAYAGNRLMVLRYNSSPHLTPKASPPDTYLKNFDTICTFPIQGWLAAVNDIDGGDGKDEILLVSGSTIFVLRMNDYQSLKFRSGKYFDTVFRHRFGNETITSAAIADVDGDGRNDIIVTTNIGMYVIGTPLERTIDMLTKTDNPLFQTDWCFGDTVKIRWKNIIQGNSLVNIMFQEVGNDTLTPLALDYPNGNDTATYNLVVNKYLAGKKGYVIVQSVINPIVNADTTGLFIFHKPSITTISGILDTLIVGGEFTIKGYYECVDNVELYYSFDSTDWVYIASAALDSLSDEYEITTMIPCIPVFDCIANKNDTTIFGRIIYKRYNSVDSTNVFPLTIRPANFPLTIEPCETICPSRLISWEIFDSLLLNEILTVLLSTDTGKTFKEIGRVPVMRQQYLFNVPSNITTPIILRFCGSSNCFKSDTMLWNYAPKYVKTVAPNPLKIPFDAEIVYQVEEDVTATMRIIDQANRYVKTIFENEKRVGGFTYCSHWNGRLDDNTVVSNGMYYIMLELSNGLFEIYPIYIRN